MCHNTGLLRVAVDQEVWGPAVIVMVSAGLCCFLSGNQGQLLHAQWRPVQRKTAVLLHLWCN